jgi:murein DD-endopeptidase MepM/ murein hydrolase activator NlpD
MILSRTRRNHIVHRLQVPFALALAFVLILSLTPLTSTLAFAVTSAEKQAEADEAMRQFDILQTELGRVTDQLYAAIDAEDAALQLMAEAKDREDTAENRTSELQQQLGTRAAETYRNGNPTFLDVFFGANSFSEFINSWDMINRLNEHDAQLTKESRSAHDEAESARQLYTEQERIASSKKQEIEDLKASLEQKTAEMSAQIEKLTAEAAELLAQEEAAAEAARLAAIAESGGDIPPDLLANMPQFVHPCPGSVVSSTFGYRDFDHSYHMGLDLAAGTGTPILAAVSGTVIIAGWSDSAGNWVVISHGNGLVTKYMHASALYVSAGQAVSAGQQIAAVGNTGNSFGAHLHFQVEINGSAINPQLFI